MRLPARARPREWTPPAAGLGGPATVRAVQIVGRECASCHELVEKVGAGDGCGACDLVMCSGCLGGTDRCPSCQKFFDEVRDAGSRAEGRSGEARLLRGRQQAVAVSVSLIGSVGLMLVLGMLPARHALPEAIVLGLLSYQILRGAPWARWVLAALTAWLTWGAAAIAWQEVQSDRGGWVIGVGLALVYGWCTLVLVLSAPLANYMRVARTRAR